jgi:predicted lactoylglutathione lyase
MIISENIFVMLLEEARFQTFTPKQIPNAHETSQVLIALDTESREEVDAILERAWPQEEQKLDQHKIMASCMVAPTMTSTDIFGKLAGWIWRSL